MSIGVGIDAEPAFIDITAGGGYLRNEEFTSSFASIGFAPRLKLGGSATLGPSFKYLMFEAPDWEGNSDIDIESGNGFLSGFEFTAGRAARFSLSLNYLDLDFDVNPGANWSANLNKIKMSGMMLMVGVMGHF